MSKTNRGPLQGLELQKLIPFWRAASLWPLLSSICRIVPYGTVPCCTVVRRWLGTLLFGCRYRPRPEGARRGGEVAGRHFITSTDTPMLHGGS